MSRKVVYDYEHYQVLKVEDPDYHAYSFVRYLPNSKKKAATIDFPSSKAQKIFLRPSEFCLTAKHYLPEDIDMLRLRQNQCNGLVYCTDYLFFLPDFSRFQPIVNQLILPGHHFYYCPFHFEADLAGAYRRLAVQYKWKRR